jgi:hypothetical protein
VDRELAAALAGELPVSANVKVDDARPSSMSCTMNASGAEFAVPGGSITVLMVPADVMVVLSGSGAHADASTSDGRHVLVVSAPSNQDDSTPYKSDLARFARNIARLY